MDRPDPDRPPPLVPSHVAWPGFVVFLLALSVAMAALTVIAARSDGGARVVGAESDAQAVPPRAAPPDDAPPEAALPETAPPVTPSP